MHLRPTIEDVARLAGVSTATVSRTLHFPARVSPDTAARVIEAVRATGYTLNVAAQTLRQRRANALLVVVPNIGNTFYGEVLAGIEQAAHAAGQTILIGDSAADPAREAAFLSYLQNGRADGALLLARPTVDWQMSGEPGRSPVVMISETPADPAMPFVRIDNVAASFDAVMHLVALGHRRIAHLEGPPSTGLTAERRAGYRDALAAAGLPADPGHVIAGDFSAASGAAAAAVLLALHPRPTAVFCANDEMAMGLIGALAQAGVVVPRDLSVVGFDDIHFAQCFVPPITTIRQPRRALGETAVTILNAILAPGAAVADLQQTLAYELVLRASTARPLD